MKIWRPRMAKLVLTLSNATSLPKRCSGEVTGDEALNSSLRIRNRSSSVLPRIAIVVPVASFGEHYTSPTWPNKVSGSSRVSVSPVDGVENVHQVVRLAPSGHSHF